MATSAQVDAAIGLAFRNMEIVVHFSYDEWEAGFVRRWQIQPKNNRRAMDYLLQRRLPRHRLTIVQAARAFHTNDFVVPPERMHLLLNMERDFDRVPPDLVEPPLRNDDWERVEKQADDFDPRNPKRRGRVVFDMGRGTTR